MHLCLVEVVFAQVAEAKLGSGNRIVPNFLYHSLCWLVQQPLAIARPFPRLPKVKGKRDEQEVNSRTFNSWANVKCLQGYSPFSTLLNIRWKGQSPAAFVKVTIKTLKVSCESVAGCMP